MGDMVVQGKRPPDGTQPPPVPDQPVNVIAVDRRTGAVTLTSGDDEGVTSAIARWTQLPQNRKLLLSCFPELDPKLFTKEGESKRNFEQLRTFLESRGLLATAESATTVGRSGTLPPASTLVPALRDWLVEEAMARLPAPVAAGPTLGSAAPGGTLDTAPRMVAPPPPPPPTSLADAESQLSAIDAQLRAVVAKVKLGGDNVESLKALYQRLQARRTEVDQARAQFSFGGALAPPSDAVVDRALAEIDDPKLTRVLERMESERPDAGERMLAAMNLYIPNAPTHDHIFDRLCPSADEKKALIRDLQVFVATGSMSPRLAAIWSDAQHSGGPYPNQERIHYIDCTYIAHFMERVQKHKLALEMKEEKAELKDAMLNPDTSARAAAKQAAQERMNAITARMRAVDVAFKPIAREWAEDNRIWLATVERERDHDMRRASDPSLPEDKRSEWAKLAAHKGTAAGNSYAYQARAAERANKPQRAVSLAVRASDSYRLAGDAEVLGGELSRKPIAAEEVPGYRLAGAELAAARRVPGGTVTDEWSRASGKLSQAKANATVIVTRAEGYSPTPSATDLDSKRTQGLAARKAAIDAYVAAHPGAKPESKEAQIAGDTAQNAADEAWQKKWDTAQADALAAMPDAQRKRVSGLVAQTHDYNVSALNDFAAGRDYVDDKLWDPRLSLDQRKALAGQRAALLEKLADPRLDGAARQKLAGDYEALLARSENPSLDPKIKADLRARGAVMQDEVTRQAARVLESRAVLDLAKVDEQVAAAQKPPLQVPDETSADLALDHAIKANDLTKDRNWRDKVKGWFVSGDNVRTLASDVQSQVNAAQLQIAARNKLAQMIRAGKSEDEIAQYFKGRGVTLDRPPSGYTEAGIAELLADNARDQVRISTQSLRITSDVTFRTKVDDDKIAQAEEGQRDALKGAVLQMVGAGSSEAQIQDYLERLYPPPAGDRKALFASLLTEARTAITARSTPQQTKGEAARQTTLLDARALSADKVSAGEWRARVDREATASALRAADPTLAPDLRRTVADGVGVAVAASDGFDEQLKGRYEALQRVYVDQASSKRKEIEADGKEADRQKVSIGFDNALNDALVGPVLIPVVGPMGPAAYTGLKGAGVSLPGDDVVRRYGPIRWLKDTEIKEKQLAAVQARIAGRTREAEALDAEVASLTKQLAELDSHRGPRADAIDLAARAYDVALAADPTLKGDDKETALRRDRATLGGARLYDRSMVMQAKAGNAERLRGTETRSVALGTSIADRDLRAQASAGHRLATRDSTEAMITRAGEGPGITGNDVSEFYGRVEAAWRRSEEDLAAIPVEERSAELVDSIRAARRVEAVWEAFFAQVERGEPFGTAQKNLDERVAQADKDLDKGERRWNIAKADCMHPLVYLLGGFMSLEQDRMMTGLLTKVGHKGIKEMGDKERAQLEKLRSYLVGTPGGSRAELLGRYTELMAALRQTKAGADARARLGGVDRDAAAAAGYVLARDKALSRSFDRSFAPQRFEQALQALAKTSGSPDDIKTVAEMYKVPAEQLEKWQPVIQGVQEAVIVVVTAIFTAGVGGAAVEGATISSRLITALRMIPGVTLDSASVAATLIRIGVTAGHAGLTMALQTGFDIAVKAVLGEGSQLGKGLSAAGQFVSLGRMNQLGRFSGMGALVIPGTDFIIRKAIIEGMADPKKQHYAEHVMTGFMLLAPALHGEKMHREQAALGAARAAEMYFPNDPVAREQMAQHLKSFYLGGDTGHMSTAELQSQLRTLEGRLKGSKQFKTPEEAQDFMAQFKAGQAAEHGVASAFQETRFDGKKAPSDAELATMRSKAEEKARAVLGLKPGEPLPETARAMIETRLIPFTLMRLSGATNAQSLTAEQKSAADAIAEKAELAYAKRGTPPELAYGSFLRMAMESGLGADAARAFAEYAATRYQSRLLLGGEKATPEAVKALTDIIVHHADKTPIQLADAIRQSVAIPAELKESVATAVALNSSRGHAFKTAVDSPEFTLDRSRDELVAHQRMLTDARIPAEKRAAELEARAAEAAWKITNETGRPLAEQDLARYKEVLDAYNQALGGELPVDRLVKDARVTIAALELATRKETPTPEKITEALSKAGLAGPELEAKSKEIAAILEERTQLRQAATSQVDAARGEIGRVTDALTSGASAQADKTAAIALAQLHAALTAKTSSGAPDAQAAAQLRFMTQFGASEGGPTSGFAARLAGKGVLADGVHGASPRVMLALVETLQRKHSSVDFSGAANIDHLATVFEGALQRAAKDRGHPLTQREIDQIALETVLTDATGKGRMPGQLADMPTAVLLDHEGNRLEPNGRGYWTQGIVHDVLGPKPDAKVQSALREMLAQSPDFVIRPDVFAAAASKHGLSDAQALDLKVALHLGRTRSPKIEAALRELLARNPNLPVDRKAALELAKEKGFSEDEGKLLAGGASLYAQPFMAGTLLHGIPDFATVERAVLASGGDRAQAQRTYESVLGHHMAGFIANGFARAGVRLDFAAMAERGQLTKEGAAKLKALYDAAIDVSGKWRPVIDATIPTSPALSSATREKMYADAAPLRDAIAALPEHIRSQLINDDTQQFSPVGIEKWLQLFNGPMAQPKTNGELAMAVFGDPAQKYYEEHLRLGTGDAFIAGMSPTPERLGIVYDAEGKFPRPAVPGEAAHRTFAEQIARDPESAAMFVRDKKLPYRGKELFERLQRDPSLERQIVEWMRARSPDPATLTRLAQQDPPATTKTSAAKPAPDPRAPPPAVPDARAYSRDTTGTLRTAEQQRYDQFSVIARDMGLRTPEEVREAFAMLGLNDKDSLFSEPGAPRVFQGEDLAPSLDSLQQRLGTREGPVSAFAMRSDIFNLAGINGAGGAVEANRVLLGAYTAYDARLRSIVEANGGQVILFRGKGGEMTTVVTFPKGDPATHREIIKRATAEAKAYAESFMSRAEVRTPDGVIALADVPNPKVAKEEAKKYGGSRFDIGLVEVTRGEAPSETVARADAALDAQKPKVPQGAKFAGPFTRRHPSAEPSVPFDPVAERAIEQPSVGVRRDSISSVDQRRLQFITYMGERGVARPEAERIFAQYAKRDRLTGFLRGEERVPTMRNLLGQLSWAPAGTRGFYGEADISNLGGLNGVLGTRAADAVYRRITTIYYERVSKAVADAGGEAHFFRRGVGEKMGEDPTAADANKAGDEICVIIKMPPSAAKAEQQIRLAMLEAEAEVRRYVQTAMVPPDNGGPPVALREIVHPKKPTNPQADGTALTFGLQEVRAGMQLNDSFSMADVRIEEKKKQPTQLAIRERLVAELGVAEELRASAAQALLALHLAQGNEATRLPADKLREKEIALLASPPPKGYGAHPVRVALYYDVHGRQAIVGEPPELSPQSRVRLRALSREDRGRVDVALRLDANAVGFLAQNPDAVSIVGMIGGPGMKSIFGEKAYTPEMLQLMRGLGREFWLLAKESPSAARDVFAAAQAGRNVIALVRDRGSLGAAVLELRAPKGGDALVRETQVPVGKPVATVEQATELVRRITAGDRTAFAALGVKPPPDSFNARAIEWGVGKMPDGKFVVVRGGATSVDWGAFPGVIAVAHTHPLTPAKELSKPVKMDEIFRASDADKVNILPSAADIQYCAEHKLPLHVVHTPYAFLGEGRVGNPTGKEPRVDIAIENATAAGRDGGATIYKAKLVARSSTGEVIWSGEVWSREVDGSTIIRATPPRDMEPLTSEAAPAPQVVRTSEPAFQGRPLEGGKLKEAISQGRHDDVVTSMFPHLTAPDEAAAQLSLQRDLGAFVTRSAEGRPSNLADKLEAADMPPSERERVARFAAILRDGIERARAGFLAGSPEAKALEANWAHLKMETSQLLEAAPRLGLKGKELSDTLIASLFSDGIKTGDLRSVIAHDVYAAEAWTRMASRFFPLPHSAETKKRIEDIRLAILEHQGVPPSLMAMFIGIEIRAELGKPENAALAQRIPNWEEKLQSLQKKIADPYANLGDAPEGNGRKIVALDAEERQLLRLVRSADWHIPNPDHPDYKKSWGVVYADFRANYLTGDGAAKIVDAYRGWKTGNGTKDATCDDGFNSVVGVVKQGPKGPYVEGGSFGDGAKFFRDKAQVDAAMADRQALIGKWNAAKAEMSKPGGWLDQRRAEFEQRFGRSGDENPFVYDPDGKIGLPYWDRPLVYPTDNRDPAKVPEAAEALAKLTPKERAQLEFHLAVKAELARQLRALDAAEARGESTAPRGAQVTRSGSPTGNKPLTPPPGATRPMVRRPDPGMTNDALAFLRPLQNEAPWGGASPADGIAAPSRIAGLARLPLLPVKATDLRPISLAENEVGSSCDVYLTRVDGRDVLVKVYLDSTPDANRYRQFIQELAGAKIFSDLNLGPKLHGVVDLGDGRLAIAMDVVQGGKHVEDASARIRDWTVRDLYDKMTTLRARGYDCMDFQYLVTPEGKIQVIDGAGIRNFDPAKQQFSLTEQLAALRANAYGMTASPVLDGPQTLARVRGGPWNGTKTPEQEATLSAFLARVPAGREVSIQQDAGGNLFLLEHMPQPDGGWAWIAQPVGKDGRAGDAIFELFDKTGARVQAVVQNQPALPPSPPPPPGVVWNAKVTPEMHLQTIDSALSHHLTAGDIAGVYADRRGQPVLQPDGTPFQHEVEMRQARRSVASAVKALRGASENRSLKPAERSYILAALKRGEAALAAMDRVLGTNLPKVTHR